MNNLKIHEKIKLIRYEEKLSRKKFADIVDMKVRTLEAIENRGNDPRFSYIQSICNMYPEYTLWVMLDKVNIEAGQLSPMIKALMIKERYWDPLYNYIFNSKDSTNVDEINEAIEEYKKITGNETVEYPLHVLEELGIKH